jgi:glutamine synthetase
MRNENVEYRNSIIESFGVNVFNDAVMRERLPKSIYKALRKTIDEGTNLSPEVAEVVANTMKDWAIERGATHFTHWFQPMTGVTAEKHESFISPTADGRAITEFSGLELAKGESDASSFPSGGLRATFEARGYTVWDCTSPAFLKEDEGGVTLYIPTAFCSYTGEALDKKTPLLRSLEAISREALRVLRLFGNTTSTKVIPTVGPEQEYFLVDKELFKKRKDLVYTGRTLFGAKPPKGQELDDHYYGSIKERVAAFMKEIDRELWKLGVTAKTKHNEVAPGQFEIASIYSNCNIATDHNQLVMDTLKKVADRHGLACLLHEKPFAGINGSGKHNNWSMATDDGQNLLEPGKKPHENKQFLIFLSTVIKAIDDYSDLLRVSAANPGNDHRLGANEAPPAIISIFLGEQLVDILDQVEEGELKKSKQAGELAVGVATFPSLYKDVTDRNRTSPFAFTGNKFEFRMVPSSTSISDANVVLNTIVAETLSGIAARLEKAENFNEEVDKVLREIVKNHRRIIFNGDGYSKEWIVEAERRGLPHLRSTVDAIPALITDKAIRVFSKHNVLSAVELHSRYEIMLEAYIKQIHIEALTMIDMAKRQIMPSVIRYISEIASSINLVKSSGVAALTEPQEELLVELSESLTTFKKNIAKLSGSMIKVAEFEGSAYEKAVLYRDEVFKAMAELRKDGDRLELLVDEAVWPFPTYGDMLFFM